MTMQSPRNDAFGGAANGGMGAAYGSAPTGKPEHNNCHGTPLQPDIIQHYDMFALCRLLIDVSKMWWRFTLWRGCLSWRCAYMRAQAHISTPAY